MSSIMRRRRGLKSAISILLSEGVGSNTHILSARRRSTPACPSRRGSGFVQSSIDDQSPNSSKVVLGDARESPGGKTIAHGLLSLSLIPTLIRDIIGLKVVKNTL